MASRASKRKKTAFVPKALFRAAATVGVVPLCAYGCGGVTLTVAEQCFADCGAGQEGGDASGDAPDVTFTVAAACFDGGVPVPCVPPDADKHDVVFTVAAACFDGGVPVPCVPPPSDAGDAFLGVAFDAFGPDGVADVGFGDVILGVAADAFGGEASVGEAGAPHKRPRAS